MVGRPRSAEVGLPDDGRAACKEALQVGSRDPFEGGNVADSVHRDEAIDP